MLEDLDARLAERFGAYASYRTEAAPFLVDYHGEDPAGEVERLLTIYARPDAHVLDLGCGAGFTICRIAPLVKRVWGIDCERHLLEACRMRVEALGLNNVVLVEGNATAPESVAQLPDDIFDLAYSERGPNMNALLSLKLKEHGYLVQELVSNLDCYLLSEILGRKFYADFWFHDAEVLRSAYAEMHLFPVSVKEFFYEEYFRDANHLEAFLRQTAVLGTWRIPHGQHYEGDRDRAGLELYVRYNSTPKGVRLLRQRKVFVFRKTTTRRYPADRM